MNKLIEIQGIERVDLTKRMDAVRRRIEAIESRFGVGGDFETRLNEEIQRQDALQRVSQIQQTPDAEKLIGGSNPVNENDAINSQRVAAILRAAGINVPDTSGNAQQTGDTAQRISGDAPGRNDTRTGDLSGSGDAEEIIRTAALTNGVDPKLARAIAMAESNINQDSISDAGAIGVMQLMPDTAATLGVNPYDMRENIEGGTRFLRQMLDTFDGDLEKSIAAYNAGPGAVKQYGGVPPYPETQNYVSRVLSLYR